MSSARVARRLAAVLMVCLPTAALPEPPREASAGFGAGSPIGEAAQSVGPRPGVVTNGAAEAESVGPPPVPAVSERDASDARLDEEPAPESPRRPFSDEARLHVVGVYEGSPAPGADTRPWWAKCGSGQPERATKAELVRCHQEHAGKREEGRISVSVHASRSPVILALMAYEPTLWTVARDEDVRIEAVILAGYHGQRVSGLPPGTPVSVHSYEPSDCGRCQVGEGAFYAYSRDSPEYRAATAKLRGITGKSPVSFQGTQKGKHFAIIDPPAR